LLLQRKPYLLPYSMLLHQLYYTKKMKSILIFSAALSAAVISNATVFTVSNNAALPGSPGQYTTIAAGVAAASTGDTILIQGSPNAYGGVQINKGLTIIGPGYNPQTSTGYTATINGVITFGNSTVPLSNSSNSKLIGLANVGVAFNNSIALSNFLISRCSNWTADCNNGELRLSGNVSGVIVEDCILSSSYCNGHSDIELNGAANVIIRNNIFTNGGSGCYDIAGSSSPVAIIRNNLFLCGSNNWGIANLNNAIFENNIFYYPNSGHPFTNITNSTFNKNYGYYCDTIPSGSNVGSGNIKNIINIYQSISWDCTTGSSFALGTNFRPAVSTVVHNAGTDGTDIGPTGGVSPIYIAPAPYPLTGEPPVPQVQSITMPASSVPSGGTMNVTVKARKRN